MQKPLLSAGNWMQLCNNGCVLGGIPWPWKDFDCYRNDLEDLCVHHIWKYMIAFHLCPMKNQWHYYILRPEKVVTVLQTTCANGFHWMYFGLYLRIVFDNHKVFGWWLGTKWQKANANLFNIFVILPISSVNFTIQWVIFVHADISKFMPSEYLNQCL